MFWNLEWNNGSQINTILEKEDVENKELLREILEEEDLLQELRTDNQTLVKFLVKDEVLGELVKMIVNEPNEDIEDSVKYKNASIACELLIADINQSEQLSDLLVDPNSSALHVSQLHTSQFEQSSPYQPESQFGPGGPSNATDSPRDETYTGNEEGSSPPSSPSALPQIVAETTDAGDSTSVRPISASTNDAGDSIEVVAPQAPAPPKPDAHIGMLFDFLKTKEINPLLASYFSRTVAELLQRKPDKIWPYIRDEQGTDFLKNLLRHINTSAIWDVLMRLMTCKEGSLKTEIVTWLSAQGLIKSLIENLKPERGSLRNQAASLALSDIVRLSRARSEFGFGNPLLDELERPETTRAILNTIIDANTQALTSDDSEAFDSTILACVNVLLTFLEPAPSAIPAGGGINNLMANNSEYLQDYTLSDEQERQVQNRYQDVIDNTLDTLRLHVADLCAVLKRDPSRHFARPNSRMPAVQFKSLGATRLNVCKLFTEILKHKNAEMNKIFVKEGVLLIMVDLFFEYCYNNFLHALVTTCIQHIMEAPPTDDSNWWDEDGQDKKSAMREDMQLLIQNLLVDCKLAHRVISAFAYEKSRNSGEKVVQAKSLPTAMPSHPNVTVDAQSDEASNLQAEVSPEDTVPVRLRPPRLPYMGHLVKIATCLAQLDDPNAQTPANQMQQRGAGLAMGAGGMANRWNGLKSCQNLSGTQNLSKTGKQSTLTPLVEKTLETAFSEAFLVKWKSLVGNEIAEILEKNSRRLGGTLPSDRFTSFIGKNNFYSNYGTDTSRNNDDDDEEDERNDLRDQSSGAVSTNAQSLYSTYSKTGLMQTQDTPADSMVRDNMFDDEDLTKGDKLGDYNQVGDYDLSLDDKNEEEQQMEYKQTHDREQYTKIVRSRIPAVNEKYEDSPDLEQQEIKEYSKEYDMGISKEEQIPSDDNGENWADDDEGESTDEKESDEGSGETMSSSGEEGDSSDDEQSPNTFPEPVQPKPEAPSVDADFDPWTAAATETKDQGTDPEFVVDHWDASTGKEDSGTGWANFDGLQ